MKNDVIDWDGKIDELKSWHRTWKTVQRKCRQRNHITPTLRLANESIKQIEEYFTKHRLEIPVE